MEEKITICEVKKKLRDLNDELETYLQLKKINYEKTQPKAMRINDILVQQSHVNVDRFCNYMIKDENLDLKITTMLEEINTYESLIIRRIKSIAMSNCNEAKIISLIEKSIKDSNIIKGNYIGKEYVENGAIVLQYDKEIYLGLTENLFKNKSSHFFTLIKSGVFPKSWYKLIQAPQWEWPQTIMCFTPKILTAYSITAELPW